MKYKFKLFASIFISSLFALSLVGPNGFRVNTEVKKGYNKVSKSNPEEGYFVNSLFTEYYYNNLDNTSTKKAFSYKEDGKPWKGFGYWPMHSQWFYKGKDNSASNSLYKNDNSGQAADDAYVFDTVDSSGNKGAKATILNTMALDSEQKIMITSPGTYVLKGDLKNPIYINLPTNSTKDDKVVIDLNGYRIINETKYPYTITFNAPKQYTSGSSPMFYLVNSYDSSQYNQTQKDLHTSTFIYKEETHPEKGTKIGRYVFLDPKQDIPDGYVKVNMTDDKTSNDYYQPNTYFQVEGGVITANNNPQSQAVRYTHTVNNTNIKQDLFIMAGLNIAGNYLTDLSSNKAMAGAAGIYIGSVAEGGGQYKAPDVLNMNSYGDIVNTNVVGNYSYDTGTAGLMSSGGINSNMFVNVVNSIVDANYAANGGGMLFYKYANVDNTDVSYNVADEALTATDGKPNISYPVTGTNSIEWSKIGGLGGGIATGDFYVNFNGTDKTKLNELIIKNSRIYDNKARIGGGIFFGAQKYPIITGDTKYYDNEKLLKLADTDVKSNLATSGAGVYFGNFGRWANDTTTDPANIYSMFSFGGKVNITDNIIDKSKFVDASGKLKANIMDDYANEGAGMDFFFNRGGFNFDTDAVLTVRNNYVLNGDKKFESNIEFGLDNDNAQTHKDFNGGKIKKINNLQLKGLTADSTFGISRLAYNNNFTRNMLVAADNVDVLSTSVNNGNIFADGDGAFYLYDTTAKNSTVQIWKAGYRIMAEEVVQEFTYDGINHNVTAPTNVYFRYHNQAQKDIPIDLNQGYLTFKYKKLEADEIDELDEIAKDLIMNQSSLETSFGYTDVGTYYYLIMIYGSNDYVDDPSHDNSQAFFGPGTPDMWNSEGQMDKRYLYDGEYYGYTLGKITINPLELSTNDFNSPSSYTYDGKAHSYPKTLPNTTNIPDKANAFFNTIVDVKYLKDNGDGTYSVLSSSVTNAGTYLTAVTFKKQSHNYSFPTTGVVTGSDGKPYFLLGDTVISQVELDKSDFTTNTSLTYNSEYQTPEYKLSDTKRVVDGEDDAFLNQMSEYYVAEKVGTDYSILQNGAKDATAAGHDYYLLVKLTDQSINYKFTDASDKVQIDGVTYLVLSNFTVEQVSISSSDFANLNNEFTYDKTGKKANIILSDGTKVQVNDKDNMLGGLSSISYLIDNESRSDLPVNAGTYKVLLSLNGKSNYKLENAIDIDGVLYLELGSIVINKKNIAQSDFTTIDDVTYKEGQTLTDTGGKINPGVVPSGDQDKFEEFYFATKVGEKYTLAKEGISNAGYYYILMKVKENSNYSYDSQIIDINGEQYYLVTKYEIKKADIETEKEWFPDLQFSVNDENKTVVYDKDQLPEGIYVDYKIYDQNKNEVRSMDAEGEYTIIFTFTDNTGNYNIIKTLESKYTVTSKALPGDMNSWWPIILIIVSTLVIIALLILVAVYLTRTKKERRYFKYSN